MGHRILRFDQFCNENVYANDGGGKFWGNMGAGVLPVCSETGRICVPFRSRHVNEPHTWGVFGGAVGDPDSGTLETDETAEDAAKRELTEESGYEGHFELIPCYVFKSSDGTFEYHNFIGIVDHEFEPTLNWETEKSEWMTFDKLMSLNPKHFGLKAFLDHDHAKIKSLISESLARA